MFKLRHSENGNILLIVLALTAVSMFLAMNLTSSIVAQNKQIKFLQQKSDIQDIKNNFLFYMQNSTTCGCNLNPSKSPVTNSLPVPTFNGSVYTGDSKLDLGTFSPRTGCVTNSKPFLDVTQATSTGLKIKSLIVTTLKPTDATYLNWSGSLEVTWDDNTNSQLPPANLTLPIQIVVDSTSPANARKVSSCILTDTAAAAPITLNCPSGMTRIGPANGRGSFCIDTSPRTANTLEASFTTCSIWDTSGNGPAHLCSHTEWKAACLSPDHPASMPVAAGERSDNDPGAGYGYDQSMFNTTCTGAADNENFKNLRVYRCCL